MFANSFYEQFKYFFADAVNHKAIVHQLYFIGSFIQAKGKNEVFFNFDSRYLDYFQNTQDILEEP